MKITREKACQRLHHRIKTPLRIRIGEHERAREYRAIDWSLGGFRIGKWSQESGDLSVGECCFCNFELPFQGFNIDFDVEVKLVRLDEPSREAAFSFVELTDRQTELMSHFIEQLVRGSMTPVQDTILRIDSPVTPVSTEPDPSPASEVPIKRFSSKKLLMSSFYLVAGLVLVTISFVTVYENFLNLKVKTAIVYAPVETLISLEDGHIRSVNASLNGYVNEGDTLFEIESPSLKKQIDEGKISVEQKKLELEERRKKHALAIETSGSPASKEARTYEIEVDRIEQEVTLATQHLVALYEYKDNLSIVSPSPGRLVKLLRGQGALVRRGETVGLFERSLLEQSVVHAYISQQQARNVHVGQEVKIRSSRGRWLGVVMDVQNNHISITGRQSGHVPDGVSSQDTLVEIEILSVEGVRQTALLRPGMSVEVLFPLFKTDVFLHSFWSPDVLNPLDENISGNRELTNAAEVDKSGRSI